jgi:hypothetical protein
MMIWERYGRKRQEPKLTYHSSRLPGETEENNEHFQPGQLASAPPNNKTTVTFGFIFHI